MTLYAVASAQQQKRGQSMNRARVKNSCLKIIFEFEFDEVRDKDFKPLQFLSFGSNFCRRETFFGSEGSQKTRTSPLPPPRPYKTQRAPPPHPNPDLLLSFLEEIFRTTSLVPKPRRRGGGVEKLRLLWRQFSKTGGGGWDGRKSDHWSLIPRFDRLARFLNDTRPPPPTSNLTPLMEGENVKNSS